MGSVRDFVDEHGLHCDSMLEYYANDFLELAKFKLWEKVKFCEYYYSQMSEKEIKGNENQR